MTHAATAPAPAPDLPEYGECRMLGRKTIHVGHRADLGHAGTARQYVAMCPGGSRIDRPVFFAEPAFGQQVTCGSCLRCKTWMGALARATANTLADLARKVGEAAEPATALAAVTAYAAAQRANLTLITGPGNAVEDDVAAYLLANLDEPIGLVLADPCRPITTDPQLVLPCPECSVDAEIACEGDGTHPERWSPVAMLTTYGAVERSLVDGSLYHDPTRRIQANAHATRLREQLAVWVTEAERVTSELGDVVVLLADQLGRPETGDRQTLTLVTDRLASLVGLPVGVTGAHPVA